MLNDPPQSAGACAERVRRRAGISRDCGARGTGDPAVIGPTLTVAVDRGTDGATGAALHSVRSAMVLAIQLCPG